jgi:serine/threonine-protein kinase HipA
MAGRTLNVLLADHQVGVLAQRPGGRHTFEYTRAWQESGRAIPLSYSMPLQQARHGTRIVTSFMWGLLPDNETTLRRWGTRYQVSPHNPFTLLAAIGEDCPGAVQIVPPNRILRGRQRVAWLTARDMGERMRRLVQDAGAGRLETDTGQFSLAGSQEKTALYRINGRWGVPQGRTPTTHILKPETGRVQHIAANEHFCLKLARQCRLAAAISEVQVIGGIPVIIVERFDRWRSGGLVRRVHQEDMCQALAKREKYQRHGGPGIYDIMEILQFSERADIDRDRFMRAQAFNYLIAGTDAHARNYSISYAPGGAFRLSPLYDVISDLPYDGPGRRSALAMTVGGKRAIADIMPRHWARQAASVRFSRDAMFGHIRELIGLLPEAAERVGEECRVEGLASPVIPALVRSIGDRCKVVRRVYGGEIVRDPGSPPKRAPQERPGRRAR